MVKDPTNTIGTLQLPFGYHTKSTGETLDHLLGAHVLGCVSRDDLARTQSTLVVTPKQIARQTITVSSIKWAVRSSNCLSWQGGQAISNSPPKRTRGTSSQSLRHLLGEYTIRLLATTLENQQSSVYPETRSSVTLKHEGLQTQKSLLVCFEVVEDTFSHHHINWGSLQGTPHEKQYVYQSEKLIKSSVHELASKIKDTLDRKEIMLTVFSGIKGAFDKTVYLNQWCRLLATVGFNLLYVSGGFSREGISSGRGSVAPPEETHSGRASLLH